MGLVIVTPAAVDPVTLDEAKTQLSISSGKWDTFISTLITVATQTLEKEANLCLIDSTLEWQQDFFPGSGFHFGVSGGGRDIIYLPSSPVSSITSVKYIDTAGVEQTLPTAEFDTDTVSLQARLKPSEGNSWPQTQLTLSAVKIRFVCGFGAAGSNVPAPLRQAILLATAAMFENRESMVAEAFTFKKNPLFTTIMGLYSLRTF